MLSGTEDPEAQFVSIAGEQYCFRMVGEGPPVVLLHGIADSSRFLWRPFLERFQAEYQIVAIDLRGHGRSAKPRHGYSTLDQVHLVLQVMDRLDLITAVLIGHSMGGIIATRLAISHPERVAGLVIYDSPLGGAAKGDMIWLAGLPFPGSLLVGSTLLPLIGRFLYDLRSPRMIRKTLELLKLFCDPRLISDEIIAEKLRCPYHAFYQSLHQVVIRENLQKDLDQLSMPTLIIRGGSDPVVSQLQAVRAAATISDSELVAITGACHFPLIERPGSFNQAMSAFLSKVR